MAVLIVDDESSTRLSLRGLLEQMGYKTVLEAKNGEEGLRLLEHEKARIKMIIADWEMPYMDGLQMLDAIAKKKEYDSVPFLLITSDLPAAEIKKLQSSQARLDAYLIKPFRRKLLEEGILAAQNHCASLRSEFALIGKGEYAPKLEAALKKTFGACAQLKTVESEEKLSKLSDELGWKLAAVFIEPPATLGDWMTLFKKSPVGQATPIVSLAFDPAEVHSFRTQAQYFFSAKERASDLKFWDSIAGAVKSRLWNFWAIEHLGNQLKLDLQQKHEDEALKTVSAMLALDKNYPEVLKSAAEVAELRGDHSGALSAMRSAIALNPCQPRYYIKCFEFIGDKGDRDLAESAARYCAGNADVLFACAKQWKLLGDEKRFADSLEKCLALNPKHKGALSLRGGESA